MQRTSWHKVVLGALRAWLVPEMVLCATVGIVGCDSSDGVSVAAEQMTNATRVQLMPGDSLFASLTAYEGTSFTSGQLESMGFPASVTITDANTISQFARLLEELDFRSTSSRYPKTVFSMTVVAWRGNEKLGSFETNGDMLRVPGLGAFRTRRTPEYVQRQLRQILPYGGRIENVIQRSGDLKVVAQTVDVHVLDSGRTFSSVRDTWCDALVQLASTHVQKATSRLQDEPNISEHMKVSAEATEANREEGQELYYLDLPGADVEGTIESAGEWVAGIERALAPDLVNGVRQCPFALNSEYGDDPPDDAVLLFETEPGWNKAGGPELLSSGLSDPNGCFVYLNGWGVKFIRNQEIEQIKAAARKAAQENRRFEFRLSAMLKAIEATEGGERGHISN